MYCMFRHEVCDRRLKICLNRLMFILLKLYIFVLEGSYQTFSICCLFLILFFTFFYGIILQYVQIIVISISKHHCVDLLLRIISY